MTRSIHPTVLIPIDTLITERDELRNTLISLHNRRWNRGGNPTLNRKINKVKRQLRRVEEDFCSHPDSKGQPVWASHCVHRYPLGHHCLQCNSRRSDARILAAFRSVH